MGLLAKIINLEGTLKFELCFVRNNMFDYRKWRSDYENFFPFILRLDFPNRCSIIDEDANATMTLYEIKDFFNGIETVLTHLINQKNYAYVYCNSENYFELRLESIPEDNVIEIVLWLNVGNQTQGKMYGYDEGVKFIARASVLQDFICALKNNFLEVMDIRFENI